MPIQRRTAAAALAIAPWAAHAQGTPRSYAIVSEFARDIRVVFFQESTGTRTRANREDRIPIDGNAFDKFAQAIAQDAIREADPGATVWPVAPLNVDLMSGRDTFAEGSTVTLPGELAAALRERGSTHLVTLTRLRDAANLRAAHGRLGDGPLEGLGFYIDRHQPMMSTETLVSSKGFLAPFLYVRATLIELPSGRVARMRRHAEGVVLAAEKADQAGDPWNVMPADRKLAVLSDMVRQDVGRLVRELVATR